MKKPCPFCEVIFTDPELRENMRNEVEQGCEIAGIASCEWCTVYAGDNPADLVQKVVANFIGDFFESLADLMERCAIDQPIEDRSLFEVQSGAEVYFPEGGKHIMFAQAGERWTPAMSYTDAEVRSYLGL